MYNHKCMEQLWNNVQSFERNNAGALEGKIGEGVVQGEVEAWAQGGHFFIKYFLVFWMPCKKA